MREIDDSGLVIEGSSFGSIIADGAAHLNSDARAAGQAF
jgi:hypothetical protein